MDYVDDLITTVRAAAGRLRRVSDADAAWRRAPGAWSAKEIVGHLIDSASHNHQRFVRASWQDDLIFSGYDQDAWVSAQAYQQAPWPELLDLWVAYNGHLARVMRATPEPVRLRVHTRHNLDALAWQPVPPDRPTSLDYFMRDYVGHLHHHLRQLDVLCARGSAVRPHPTTRMPAKSALLVIDVQRGLFEGTPRPHEADTVVDRINALTARARTAGVPVVFVQHETLNGPLAHGSDGWQLERRLVVDDRDVRVRKTTPDSFLHTELGDLLAGWGTETLVICGYASEFCVDTTVRRAAASGFPVVLVADAHTTHDKAHASGAEIRAHHNATLPDIVSFGPVIDARRADEVEFGTEERAERPR